MAVVSRGERTYQATDLAGPSRRTFLEEAKDGVARLRDQDGSSLVMLPESVLGVLRELRGYLLAYLSLENALTRPVEQRRPTDFGEIAWADGLDESDLEEFRAEFSDALARSAAAQDLTTVEETLKAWRLTAELLSDPDAVAMIDAELDDAYVEVPRPADPE